VVVVPTTGGGGGGGSYCASRQAVAAVAVAILPGRQEAGANFDNMDDDIRSSPPLPTIRMAACLMAAPALFSWAAAWALFRHARVRLGALYAERATLAGLALRCRQHALAPVFIEPDSASAQLLVFTLGSGSLSP
jgi:hypothetical protein